MKQFDFHFITRRLFQYTALKKGGRPLKAIASSWCLAYHGHINANTLSFEAPATNQTKRFWLSRPSIDDLYHLWVFHPQFLFTACLETNVVLVQIQIAVSGVSRFEHGAIFFILNGIIATIGLNDTETSKRETKFVRSHDIQVILLWDFLKSFCTDSLGDLKKGHGINDIVFAKTSFQFDLLIGGPLIDKRGELFGLFEREVHST